MVKNRKRKSKSMKRRKKRSIKLNRKFNRNRSRRRRRKKQRGGAPAWLSGITGFFTKKKKEPEFTDIANKQQTPQTPAGKQSDTFMKQMEKQINKVQSGVGALADKTANTVANVTNNIVNRPELKGIVDRSAMNDFQKLEVDFKKLKDQFNVIGDWINKRTKDPTKCPCCKRPLDNLVKIPAGKGVVQQPTSQNKMPTPPSTQTPQQPNEKMEQMKQMEQMGQMNQMNQMDQMNPVKSQ
jgi:hypothetical protein